jgi:hypothetical protein
VDPRAGGQHTAPPSNCIIEEGIRAIYGIPQYDNRR